MCIRDRGRCSGKRRAFWRAHSNFKLRLVVYWQKVLTNKHEQRNDTNDHQQTGEHYHPTMMHRPGQQFRVTTVDRPVEARLLGPVIGRLGNFFKSSLSVVVTSFD